MDQDCQGKGKVLAMRENMKTTFDEVCAVSQKISCMAEEIKDRLFGVEVSPGTSHGETAERLQPTTVAYITSQGFHYLRESQDRTAEILDTILAKL